MKYIREGRRGREECRKKSEGKEGKGEELVKFNEANDNYAALLSPKQRGKV